MNDLLVVILFPVRPVASFASRKLPSQKGSP
jgi:hypothetical protein